MLTSFVAEPLLTGLGAGGYMLVAGGGRGADAARLLRRRRPTRARRRLARSELQAIDVSFGDAEQVVLHRPGLLRRLRRAGRRLRGGRAAGARCRSTELAAPAAALAREGVALNAGQAYVAEILADLLTSTPECAALWAPGGRVLREGELLRNPELGRRAGSASAREGAEPFYRGDIAAAVCDWLGERGGSLARERPRRLRGDRARSRCSVAYRDREILTNPPPSAGGTLLAYSLALLDRGPAPPTLRGGRRGDGRRAGRAHARVRRGPRARRASSSASSPRGSARPPTSRCSTPTGCACSVTCTNGEGSGVVVPGHRACTSTT